MNSESSIGIYEAVCLTVLVMVNKIFFTSVGTIVYTTGTAAWYTTLISCIIVLFFFMLVYLLLKRFPGKDLVGIFEAVLGKVIGKALALAICGFLIFNAGSTLREFVEMIKVYTLPYTPTSIIMITFLAVTAIISYFGLQTLSRISAFCFIPSLIGLALIMFLASPSYDINLLKPLGGYGLSTTMKTGATRSSAYFEFILLSFAINAVGGHKTYKRISLTSILLAGGIFSISLLCYLMTYGYTAGSENISGLFELSKSIYFSRFIQRLESIFLFIWVISSVISTTASYYVGQLIYCKAFTIKDHRPLLIPFAILVFIVGILPDSMQVVTQVNINFLRQYSSFIIYLPITVVLLLAIILRKKGGGINA